MKREIQSLGLKLAISHGVLLIPIYPVNTDGGRVKLNSYCSLASKEKLTHFGGRLGTYQYLDMHMAIASAMSLFENVLTERLA
jgi:UDP-galactopyranose mutase